MSVSWSTDYQPEPDAPAYEPEYHSDFETCEIEHFEFSYVSINGAWDRFVDEAETVVAEEGAPPDVAQSEQYETFLRLVEPSSNDVLSTRSQVKNTQNEFDAEYAISLAAALLRYVVSASLHDRALDLSVLVEIAEGELKHLKRLHRSVKKKPKRAFSTAQLRLI